MADTSDIRNGLCMEYNNGIYTVVEFQHVKPGKGPAFVRTKLKNVMDGRVVDNTFPSGHKINVVRIERRKHQYLYPEDGGYAFMDSENFEQITLNAALFDRPELLKEGMEVDVMFHAEKEIPLSIEMPTNVVLKITYTEPGLKGDTATNTLKPAKVETGAEVRVPLFVNEGDLIKIDTSTGAYVERVKQ
jgi:elongation factor P